MKNNILYVYGYGSSAKSETAKLLKSIFKDDNVYCVNYPQHNIKKSIELLQNTIKSNDINIVVASSYGAFVSLFLKNTIKFLFNPCMKPSVELPKIRVADKEFLEECKKYEGEMDKIPFENTVLTYGMFSNKDELLGIKYYEMFKHYGTPVPINTCGHRVNEETLKFLKENMSIMMKNIKTDWMKL